MATKNNHSEGCKCLQCSGFYSQSATDETGSVRYIPAARVTEVMPTEKEKRRGGRQMAITQARERLLDIATQLDPLTEKRKPIEERKNLFQQALKDLIENGCGIRNEWGQVQLVARNHSYLEEWVGRWHQLIYPESVTAEPKPESLVTRFVKLFVVPEDPSRVVVRCAENMTSELCRLNREARDELAPIKQRMVKLYRERQRCNHVLIRRRLSDAQRETIWIRDHKRCYLCGETIKDWTGEFLHVDHVDAFSRGGSNDLSNLRATHPKCNLSKGSHPLPDDGA